MGAFSDFAQGWLKGGIPGGIGGVMSGREERKAGQAQQVSMDEAIASQDRLRREMEVRRQRDLDRTMGFYGPALSALEHLYGIPMSAWGQGLPQNAQAAMAPPRQGMLNGQPVNIANLRPEFKSAVRPLGGAPTPVPGIQRMATLRAPFRKGG